MAGPDRDPQEAPAPAAGVAISGSRNPAKSPGSPSHRALQTSPALAPVPSRIPSSVEGPEGRSRETDQDRDGSRVRAEP
jgi:hypothetical protein